MKMSQRALASTIGVSLSSVERWLAGTAAMTVDTLELIAGALKVPASDLLRKAEELRAAAQSDELAAKRLAKSTPRRPVAAQDEERPPPTEDPVLD